MAYLCAIAAAHSEVALYTLSVLTGVLPRVLALLQRRGFGSRRRRRGGVFGALGTLLFILVVGPIVLLALLAYFVYGMLSGRRRR